MLLDFSSEDSEYEIIDKPNTKEYTIDGEKAGAFSYRGTTDFSREGSCFSQDPLFSEFDVEKINVIHDGKFFQFQFSFDHCFFVFTTNEFNREYIDKIKDHIFNSIRWAAKEKDKDNSLSLDTSNESQIIQQHQENGSLTLSSNIYEGLGIKIKYFDPWELGVWQAKPSCLNLCMTQLSIPDDDPGTMILIMDKFDSPKIKNECKCDTLLEYVKYEYENTISKYEDLVFINDNQTTLTDDNIPAIQMEYEQKGWETSENTTDRSYEIITTGKNSFYKITFIADKNEQYSKYLDDFKKILNSLQFVTTNETKKKQPSFIIPKDKEELNQLEKTDQQQPSELTLYEDPKGRFTLEYDSSLWTAIPDKNKFDGIEVNIADKETGGDEAAIKIGFKKDPVPSILTLPESKEAIELVLPEFIDDNEDKQLEEGVECQKMAIQGYDTCSFIYSEPKTYFESYPRNYVMMVAAKIGDEMWLATFVAAENKFFNFEHSVIQIINSIKIIY